LFYLTQGFLGGLLFASIVLWFIHSTLSSAASLRKPGTRANIELFAIAVCTALFLFFFGTEQPMIHWVQRAIGIISGIAFRNWFEVTIRDFIFEVKHDNQQIQDNLISITPPKINNSKTDTTSTSGLLQWAPWRNLLLILVLLLMGLLVPRIEPWLKQINRIKAGVVEIELTQQIQSQKKISMERERQASTARQALDFADWNALKKVLEYEVRMQGLRVQKTDCKNEHDLEKLRRGTIAYFKIHQNILDPVMTRLYRVFEQNGDYAGLKQFVGKLSWLYGEFINASEEIANKSPSSRTISILNALQEFQRSTLELSSDIDKSFPKTSAISRINGAESSRSPQTKPGEFSFSESDAIALVQFPRTYTTLAALNFLSGNPMSAIALLEHKKVQFPGDFNFKLQQAQYWDTEGHSLEFAIDALRSAEMIAEENLLLARNPYNDCDNLKFSECLHFEDGANTKYYERWVINRNDCSIDSDLTRSERRLNLARNAWAFAIAQFGPTPQQIRNAKSKATAALEYFALQIAEVAKFEGQSLGGSSAKPAFG
jgi:hypothetical protein